ncbi:FIG000859: hypothetical protein YebC [invertebrate metagenome]|uniref:Transcriptional regulatory protein n=1 Tax=invertebrate metagenome TaxID=1711999 RepID=A0A484H7P5_9ZZZZ
MYRKETRDTKRARVFAKLAREIMVACRTGLPQPELNPRLRAAIQAARNQNMPKDRIERSISRSLSTDDCSATYEDVRYEGYGPGNVAVIVETITDNRNRTASEIRASFSKNGGTLGLPNSVSFYFERVGTFHYPTSAASAEVMLEIAIDVGASDVSSSHSGHRISCAPDDLCVVREALERRFGIPADTVRLEWRPLVTVAVADENIVQNLLQFLDSLEDNEDVQHVVANFDIPKTLIERLCL